MQDSASLKSEKLAFIKIGNKRYVEKVEGLYDFLDKTDMDIAFDAMIKQLSSYNVNQIFEVYHGKRYPSCNYR